MSERRVSLYDRLPEIYRIRDQEQSPPGQLRALVTLVERAFGEIHGDIEGLYDNLFIETCDDWLIPYIGDLLGTSHLAGDPWTLRADVADTVALRRRKGTPASIARLTHGLTGWGVHLVELRENLAWNHHLNHQRPDNGGEPPHTRRGVGGLDAPRGGTAAVRDPALLGRLGTPSDPFARLVDLRPRRRDVPRYNLPNLAVFLWRLAAYGVGPVRPGTAVATEWGGVRGVRIELDPLARPLRLFSSSGFDPVAEPPEPTAAERAPGPIPAAGLHSELPSGVPEAYLAVDVYSPDAGVETGPVAGADRRPGLVLHLPAPAFHGRHWPVAAGETSSWRIRGADLGRWEPCVRPGLEVGDIVVDPDLGRVLIGVATDEEAAAIEDGLRVTWTYGAVGPVGAHPVARSTDPAGAGSGDGGAPATVRVVGAGDGATSLEDALADLHQHQRVVVEIRDSEVHDLDLAVVQGVADDPDGPALQIDGSVVIRAAPGQRPVVRLARPLRARAQDPARAAGTRLRLEGLHIAPGAGWTADDPLLARAALDALEVLGCTLDPGGHRTAGGDRAESVTALRLDDRYGYQDDDDAAAAFDQVPAVVIQRSVAGPLRIGRRYTLDLSDTILDAGQGVDEDVGRHALAAPDDPAGYGPPTSVHGVTIFGPARVERIQGRGAICVHALDVLDNQVGCLRYSYLSGTAGDRIPQNVGCVHGAALRFTDDRFGEPGYAQLATGTARQVLDGGPDNDQMGAFGFLRESHKWRNLQIRYREFIPVGVRPILVSVT